MNLKKNHITGKKSSNSVIEDSKKTGQKNELMKNFSNWIIKCGKKTKRYRKSLIDIRLIYIFSIFYSTFCLTSSFPICE